MRIAVVGVSSASCRRTCTAILNSRRCCRLRLQLQTTTKRASSSDSRRSNNNNKSFLQSLFSLEGKSCIVTGGGTGIGAELAMGLARAGASVVLTGRRHDVLENAVQTIQNQLDKDDNGNQSKQRAYSIPCDVTDFGQITNLVTEAEGLTGGIPPTILVNNAGINVRQHSDDLTSDHWHVSLELMLTAPFMVARAMSTNFAREKYGRIVNIASLQSFHAFPNSIPYAAAKSGTVGLTRALAEAYSEPHGYPNTTCNAIAPGYVKTELTKSVFADAERSQKLADATIVGRNSIPNDLVGATIFLCSPASAYVTGQTLPVDGGFTALGMR